MVTITASRPSTHYPAAGLLRAFGNLLVRMAETTPHSRALDQLNAISDEVLLARGTTRDAEIRRHFGAYLHC